MIWTMIYYIATMAIALVNVNRLLKLHRNHYLPRASEHSKGQPLLTCYFFHNLHVNTPMWKKITKSHPFQWILHKCQMTSMCSNGQYAAFSVNKMHISKIYTLFPIKCNQTTHNSNKITSQKKYNKKTTFSRKYFPILVNQMERQL